MLFYLIQFYEKTNLTPNTNSESISCNPFIVHDNFVKVQGNRPTWDSQ